MTNMNLIPVGQGEPFDLIYPWWQSLRCILIHQVNGHCSIDQIYRHVGFSKSTCRKHARILHKAGFLTSGETSILELTLYARNVKSLTILDLPFPEAGLFAVPSEPPCYDSGLSYWLQFEDTRV